MAFPFFNCFTFDDVCQLHALAFKPLIWHCVLYPSISILLSGLSTTWHLCKSMCLLKRRYSRLSERQNSWPSIPPLEILLDSSCWIRNYNDDISCFCDNWFMLCSLITSVILEETFFIIFTIYISEWHWSWTLGIIQKCKFMTDQSAKTMSFSNSPFQPLWPCIHSNFVQRTRTLQISGTRPALQIFASRG